MAIAQSPSIDSKAAQQAVAVVAAQFTAQLRSVTRPDVVALGKWSVTELAAHVSHAIDGVTAVAQGGGALIGDLASLSTLTEMLVEGESTRELGELASRMDASVAQFLAVMAANPPEDRRVWIVEGIELPLSTITCHVLNELVVHGYDIARAIGVAWPIDRSHAAMIVSGFLFPVLGQLGRAVVDQGAAAGKHICFDVRLRGGGRAWLVFDDGDLSVFTSPPGPADCHLSVDPVAFLLVSWGRIDQWPAIGQGKMLSWGRKPWLGLQLRSLLLNP